MQQRRDGRMSRTVIVTGANGGMGSQAVEQLLKGGCSVIMACRTPWKAELKRASLLEKYPYADLKLMQLDLCVPESIAAFVNAIKEDGITVNALFNNAGVLAHEYVQTAEGYESTLATNLIGPARLINGLLTTKPLNSPAQPGLFAPDAQIVNMVSLACYTGRINDDFFSHRDKKFHQIWRYSDSKLGFMLYSLELQGRLPSMGYPGIQVDVADPGIVDTEMIRLGKWFDPLTDLIFRPLCNTPLRGATPAVNALQAGPEGPTRNIRYYVGKGFKPVPKRYVGHPRRSWLYEELMKRL